MRILGETTDITPDAATRPVIPTVGQPAGPVSDDGAESWASDFFGAADDGFPTESSELQQEVEDSIAPLLGPYQNGSADLGLVKLDRAAHVKYIQKNLFSLPSYFISLDASKPWLVYWALHALDLLGTPIPPDTAARAIATLAACQDPEGGFAGGPGQLPHVAPTYAAVNALAIIGTEEAFAVVKRPELLSFLLRMKQPDGSFIMHEGGEVDVRGSYCALAPAKFLNILTPALRSGCGAFIARCQTHEGGIAGVPGLEAHGGYTFCALAALEILQETSRIDLPRLAAWLSRRQMAVEGGFQGRANKLVDGCYAFWQGAAATIVECALARVKAEDLEEESGKREDIDSTDMYDRVTLQEYVLLCCQDPGGGLRDKPEKSPDYYHTCYVLSGLSIAQHSYRWSSSEEDIIPRSDAKPCIVGAPGNKLPVTHPVYNVLVPHVARICSHFHLQHTL
ncbi:terpenoid cyclases/protein prenyltransferase alpha-alpha toroid [Geranomyces variabilis]|nr:terpenoid cyclases/protein prenyltransferase alpha-alpha toroid [Geranomyces variabilis]KAJ3143600.1 hypothetical protein HDU90_000363 [Geranomyces variabilis]